MCSFTKRTRQYSRSTWNSRWMLYSLYSNLFLWRRLVKKLGENQSIGGKMV